MTPISAKVAKILNEHELVLTAGASQNVVVGMRFDIVDPAGQDIKDPDTHVSLGNLDLPKVRLRVTRVRDRISVASTLTKRVNVGGVFPSVDDPALRSFSRALMPPQWVTKYETLKTPHNAPRLLDEGESIVEIGDTAIQVLDESASASAGQVDTSRAVERRLLPS